MGVVRPWSVAVAPTSISPIIAWRAKPRELGILLYHDKEESRGREKGASEGGQTINHRVGGGNAFGPFDTNPPCNPTGGHGNEHAHALAVLYLRCEGITGPHNNCDSLRSPDMPQPTCNVLSNTEPTLAGGYMACCMSRLPAQQKCPEALSLGS